jgi:hypothetical protein
LPVIEPVSLGARHHALDALGESTGRIYALDCRVERQSGVVDSCRVRNGDGRLDEEAAARRMVLGSHLDVSAFDPTDTRELRTDINVDLSRNDRVIMLSPPQEADVENVIWSTEPSSDEIAMAMAGVRGVIDKPVDVVIPCQVQADLSVACLQPQGDVAGQDVSKIGLYWLTRDLRASPTLADGKPSVGAWTELYYWLVP